MSLQGYLLSPSPRTQVNEYLRVFQLFHFHYISKGSRHSRWLPLCQPLLRLIVHRTEQHRGASRWVTNSRSWRDYSAFPLHGRVWWSCCSPQLTTPRISSPRPFQRSVLSFHSDPHWSTLMNLSAPGGPVWYLHPSEPDSWGTLWKSRQESSLDLNQNFSLHLFAAVIVTVQVYRYLGWRQPDHESWIPRAWRKERTSSPKLS